MLFSKLKCPVHVFLVMEFYLPIHAVWVNWYLLALLYLEIAPHPAGDLLFEEVLNINVIRYPNGKDWVVSFNLEVFKYISSWWRTRSATTVLSPLNWLLMMLALRLVLNSVSALSRWWYLYINCFDLRILLRVFRAFDQFCIPLGNFCGSRNSISVIFGDLGGVLRNGFG